MTWSRGPDLLNSPRYYSVSLPVPMEDQIWVVGGVDHRFQSVKTTERFRDGKWETVSGLKIPRAYFTGVAVPDDWISC